MVQALRYILALLLLLIKTAVAAPPDPIIFHGALDFAQFFNRGFRGDEALSLTICDWKASDSDPRIFIRWWSMIPGESSFRVRRWDKSVLQRTDYHGAHYNLLAFQAQKQGIVNWPDGMAWSRFKKTQEWSGYKDHLDFHPWEGDALALSYFRWLALKYGLDAATAGWKVSPDDYLYGKALIDRNCPPRGLNREQRQKVAAAINGSLYLQQVKANEKSLLKMIEKCRREAETKQGVAK